ncbi:MAG: superoxide dismutase [Blastocatellia bacterium]|nr:superoxide dismutase [Blastocatellia bacterium]
MNKINRRNFLTTVATVTVGSTVTVKGFPNIISNRALPFELPPLPYADNALTPVISSNTIGFHYGKHHKGYVDTLNRIAKGTKYENMSLEQVVLSSAKNKKDTAIFNNAAQIWNHNFYWNCLKPNGGGKPTGVMAQKIDEAFGNYDNFKKQFAEVTISQFGTGWGWLAADKKGKLSIVKTEDADLPLTMGMKPLLTIDVWEHAYYLDYQNRRADHVNTVIDKLLNWEFAAKNLG